MALAVASRTDRPDQFAAWEAAPAFAAGERHPIFGRFGRQFYPATYNDCVDLSFAVLQGGEPLMLVPCNLFDRTLGHYGQPVPFLARRDLSEAALSGATGSALQALDRLAKDLRAGSVLIRDEVAGAALSTLGRGCVGRQATAQVKLHGFCDLSWDEPRFRRNLRKSFQSLVNWGKRNLRIAYVNAASPDRDLFQRYREFHAGVAGRVTRSDASWAAMFDWIAAGGGELGLAYLADDTLVAGTMSIDGSEVTYYASGVYDRERFDQPLAHFPLYNAIFRSRERGMRHFDLGELPAKGSVDDKEFNIGYFKRGFATSIEMHLAWRWDMRVAADLAAR